MEYLKKEALNFLKELISTPSFSGKEQGTALVIENYLARHGIGYKRHGNNLWATNLFFDPDKPTILLNSHHDTVEPNEGYTRDPFNPNVENGKLYGLGSNDAGASLVGLWATFVHFYRMKLPYNLIFAATAEEEIFGENGIASILCYLPEISFAIVGEPTLMKMAIAERGLLVIDGQVRGTSSHAAHENNDQALQIAIDELLKLRNFGFEKESTLLGRVKITPTALNAGKAHNVIPAKVSYTLDIRLNEMYSPEVVFSELEALLSRSILKARSFRLRPSSIDVSHAIVKAAKKCDVALFGSSTISDQALLNFDSVKLGIGDTLRSHSSDEYVHVEEIEHGIDLYRNLLSELFQTN